MGSTQGVEVRVLCFVPCVLLCSDFLSISNLLLSLVSQATVATVPLLLNERLAAVILDCVADLCLLVRVLLLYGMLRF